MSTSATLWKNRCILIGGFDNAINHGIRDTLERCGKVGQPPQEPDFVAGLALESSPLIYSTLRSVLDPCRVSVSVLGVFCHQTPQVAFPPNLKPSCELGDILFAYVHTPKRGPVVRNAILFQAKLSKAATYVQRPYRIRGKQDQLQLHLYMDWPDFQYTRISSLPGQGRTVTPKAPHAGAQYLLIDGRCPLGRPMGCCMPDKFLYVHTDLESELFNLFTFRTGRPFEDGDEAAKRQGWSQVVWDLLETAVDKSFNRKRSGRYNSPRLFGCSSMMPDGASFAAASSPSSQSTVENIVGRPSDAELVYRQDNDIPPENRVSEGRPDDLKGGISIVLIETSEQQALG